MTATSTYLIATVTGPLVIAALIVLPALLIRDQVASSLEGRTLAVVARESLLPAVRAEFTPLGATLEAATEESGLAERVRAGDLHGYVVFPAGVLGTEDPRYVMDASTTRSTSFLSMRVSRGRSRYGRRGRRPRPTARNRESPPRACLNCLATKPALREAMLTTLPIRSELTRCTKSSRLTSTTWVLGISLVRYVPVFWMFRKPDGISELRSRSYIPDGGLAVRPDRAEALHR